MVPDSSSNLGDNLLQDSMYFVDGSFYNNGADSDFLPDTDENGVQRPTIRRSEEILQQRAENGLICREVPVKETHIATFSELLYRSIKDDELYEIKVFHKSHLVRLRVAPSEIAMTDVLREVSVMKMLDHPNIVNLIEVIDDPNIDNFYI